MLWVGNLDLSTELGLLNLQGHVEQRNPGLFDASRHPRVNDLLVHNDTSDQFSVEETLALFLDQLDVLNIGKE